MMSDWKTRDGNTGSAMAFLMMLTLGAIMGALAFCSNVHAGEQTTIVTVVSHDTAFDAMQDCVKRSGQIPNSAFPSCYTGDASECTIIIRRPAAGMDDYAARDQIGKEVGNCLNGHQFPVNPIIKTAVTCTTEADIVDRLSSEIEAAGYGSIHILHSGQMQAISEPAPHGVLAFVGDKPVRLVVFGDGKCATAEKTIPFGDARLSGL